jgi:hypothetical protein
VEPLAKKSPVEPSKRVSLVFAPEIMGTVDFIDVSEIENLLITP